MTYTVYIDVLFAVNLLMDGILLLLVRSCLRLHAPAWRILLAAGAGAAWGCLAEVGLLAGPAAGFPGLLGAGTAMVWIAFEMGRTGTARARLCRLAKGTAALFATAFVCGGAWAGMETFLLGDSSRQEDWGGYKAAAWLLLAAGAVGAGRLCLLSAAKDLNEPVLLHVLTKKGKGYSFAEEDPAKFHGIGKFDPETGKKLATKVKTFSDSLGECLEQLAQEDPRICAITAAMPGGTGILNFQKRFPSRTFDVGIAEEHAVSMAGGLAKQGAVPLVVLYSTFLQRSYDQLMEDVGLLGLHVVLAVDRAGLVGDDGPTHHGVFDVGFLRQIPGMRILTPVSLAEQQDMLRWAAEEATGPVAVRYPRGTEGSYSASDWNGLEGDLVKCHRQGKDVTLVTYGNLLDNVLQTGELLAQQGVEATILRLLTVSELPTGELARKMASGKPVVVIEETCTGSGIREALAWEMENLCPGCKVAGRDLGHRFIPHGAVSQLHQMCGLDSQSLTEFVKEVLSA